MLGQDSICSNAVVVLWWCRSHSACFWEMVIGTVFISYIFFYLDVVKFEKQRKQQKFLKRLSKCHFQVCSNSKAEAFTQSFLKRSLKHQSKYDPKDVLSHKALMLEFARQKKDTSASKHKKAKGLNARQKRENSIYQIMPEHQRLVIISGMDVYHC